MKKIKLPAIRRIFIYLIVFVVIFAVVILIQLNQNNSQKTVVGPSLMFVPSIQNIGTNESSSLLVVMSSLSGQISGVDIEITYDPSVVSVKSVSKGNGVASLSNEIRNTIDNENGKILYTIYTLDKSGAISGSNIEVAQIDFMVKPTALVGPSLFNFGSNSALSAIGEGQNVLSETSSANIIIGEE